MTTEREPYVELMRGILGEMLAILDSGQSHEEFFHEGPAFRADPVRACPGCRFVLLSGRLAELASSWDDRQPQVRLGGRSMHDVLFDKMTALAAREAAASPLPASLAVPSDVTASSAATSTPAGP